MTVSLDVCVQHHPSRADLLPALLRALPASRVVADPEPTGYRSAWRTYQACLEQPVETSHRLVVQDDALPCRDFVTVVERAIEARPENPLVLFAANTPAVLVEVMEYACETGRGFAPLPAGCWVPAVAVVWPTGLIPGILDYVAAQNWPRVFTADDEILGRASRALGARVLVTVPSLVQHPDVAPSVVSRRREMRGLDLGRVAWCFADDAGVDPLAINWLTPT